MKLIGLELAGGFGSTRLLALAWFGNAHAFRSYAGNSLMLHTLQWGIRPVPVVKVRLYVWGAFALAFKCSEEPGAIQCFRLKWSGLSFTCACAYVAHRDDAEKLRDLFWRDLSGKQQQLQLEEEARKASDHKAKLLLHDWQRMEAALRLERLVK
jgi:hypothetical protein